MTQIWRYTLKIRLIRFEAWYKTAATPRNHISILQQARTTQQQPSLCPQFCCLLELTFLVISWRLLDCIFWLINNNYAWGLQWRRTGCKAPAPRRWGWRRWWRCDCDGNGAADIFTATTSTLHTAKPYSQHLTSILLGIISNLSSIFLSDFCIKTVKNSKFMQNVLCLCNFIIS